jgi:hypothetical protein
MKNKILNKIFAICIIGLFFMQFVSATSPIQDATGTLNIYVLDNNVESIENGIFIISGLNDTFLRRGQFSDGIIKLSLNYGHYNIRIIADDFKETSLELNINSNEINKKVQLEKINDNNHLISNVEIFVLDNFMNEINNGFIVVHDKDNNFISREYFTNGKLNLKLPYDKYILHIYSDKFNQQKEEVIINKENSIFRFILTKDNETQKGKLKIHILDEKGNNIPEGFIVSIDAKDNVVNREPFRNGIAYLELPFGRHKLEVFADNFEKFVQDIVVQNEESVLRFILNKKDNNDKPLPKYGTFFAHLIDKNGKAIERATLTIYDANTGKIVSSNVFRNGESKAILYPGTYRLDISANGYKSHAMNVIIKEDEIIKQRIILEKIIKIENIYGNLNERINLELGNTAIYKNENIKITYENFIPNDCRITSNNIQSNLSQDEIKNCMDKGLFEISIKEKEKPILNVESFYIKSFSTDKKYYETGENILFSARILNKDGSIALPEQGIFASLFIVQNVNGIEEMQKHQMFYNVNTKNYEFKIQATNENEFVSYIVVSRANTQSVSEKINYFVKLPQISIPGDVDDRHIPRIMYWYGKVNQHWDLNQGVWKTDSDGVSGANLDKLEYCKKFYPNTIAVREYKYETIDTWKDRGNLGRYGSTKLSYECLQRDDLMITIDCAEGYIYSNGNCIKNNQNNAIQSRNQRAIDVSSNKNDVNRPISIKSNQIPYNCISWFDGCNECKVLENDFLACTKRYCESYEQARCIEYVNEKPIEHETEKTFKIILNEGESTRIGDYVLNLVRLSESKTMIYLQESSKITDLEQDIIYGCQPGCKEVPEGCLCPKIIIKSNNGQYDVVSTEGTNYNIDSLKILPGSANVIGKKGINEIDITASNLEQGIQIEVNQDGVNKNVNLRTSDKDLKTFIDENEFSAGTRLTIETDVGNLYVLSNNEKREIKILPSQASNRANEVINTLFDRVEIIEKGNKIVYEMESEKEFKILGIVSAKADVKVLIDAEDGDVINVQKPWFASISTN